MEKLVKWIANNVKQLDNDFLCEVEGCIKLATHKIHRKTNTDLHVCEDHTEFFKNKIKRKGDLYV